MGNWCLLPLGFVWSVFQNYSTRGWETGIVTYPRPSLVWVLPWGQWWGQGVSPTLQGFLVLLTGPLEKALWQRSRVVSTWNGKLSDCTCTGPVHNQRGNGWATTQSATCGNVKERLLKEYWGNRGRHHRGDDMNGLWRMNRI